MRALLAITETAAELHLRGRTVALLETLRPIAQAITESEENNTATMQARDVLTLCTSPVRTLTEVAETAAVRKLDPLSGLRWHNDFLVKLVPAPRNENGTRMKDASLAQRLTLMEWHYVVDELVARSPEAYAAITTELDELMK